MSAERVSEVMGAGAAGICVMSELMTFHKSRKSNRDTSAGSAQLRRDTNEGKRNQSKSFRTVRCSVVFWRRNGYDCTRVAVERNGEIVPRGSFGDILLDDSDTIEIVRFVGGG